MLAIRAAAPHDAPHIRAVNETAFGRAAEADLVEALRADGDAMIELVAQRGGEIVGHILFSPLKITREGETLEAAALAPMAVAPAAQRNGVGAALIHAGTEACRARGAPAIVVLGHANYYPRFGFRAACAESLSAPFSGEAFMALELLPGVLAAGGAVRYAAAFGIENG